MSGSKALRYNLVPSPKRQNTKDHLHWGLGTGCYMGSTHFYLRSYIHCCFIANLDLVLANKTSPGNKVAVLINRMIYRAYPFN